MTIKTNFKCNINHKYHKYSSINLGNIGQSKRIRDIYIDDHHVYKDWRRVAYRFQHICWRVPDISIAWVIGHPMVMTEAHYKIVTSRAFRLLHVAETFRVLPEMPESCGCLFLQIWVQRVLKYLSSCLTFWLKYISSSLVKIKTMRVITCM